jgi:threonine dehydratase
MSPRTTLGLPYILEARRNIRPYLSETALLRSETLSEVSGGNIWLKLENRQPTGSFKVRGALNKISTLDPSQKNKTLVTGSAGNHGLGVAFAASMLGFEETHIFIPGNAPKVKVNKLQRFCCSIHIAGETYEEAHRAAEEYAREHDAVYIQAYDDVDVIAGQATIGLETIEVLPDMDVIIIPVGGGGLIAGIASAVKAIQPACRVIGVQAKASPAAFLSLRDGQPYDPYDHNETIADGLAGGFGKIPFYLSRLLIDEIFLAEEIEMRTAVYTLLTEDQIIAEPSGAASIVPVLSHQPDLKGKNVVCVISGGNLDVELLREIVLGLGESSSEDRRREL